MKKLSFILVAFLILVNACGPSVEGETKEWEANLKAVEKAKADYPSFASLLDTKVAEAKALWDEAASVSDEKAKAEKMSAANALLSTECVGNLIGMKDKIKEVQENLDKVESLRKGKEGENRTYAEDAITDAEKALTAAKEALTGSSCDDIDRAFEKLGTVVTDLTTAITKLSASETVTDSTKTNANTTNATEVKMVKCEHCDSKNEATNEKCKNCGAPIK